VGSYYYLVSQLPHLIYGLPPPIPSAEFREFVKPLMDEDDAALIDLISLDPQPVSAEGPSYAENAPASGSEFIDGWRDWERALRLNLARYRAARLKREGGAPLDPPAVPADAAAAAKAVTDAGSPLEGEILIDKARWSAIEYLQGGSYFGRNTVFAYLLKLILLERRMSFDNEKGSAEYESLYASILDSVQSGVMPMGELR